MKNFQIIPLPSHHPQRTKTMTSVEQKNEISGAEFYENMTVENGGCFCCANIAAQWTDCTYPPCIDNPEECECCDECLCCEDDGGRCVVKKMNEAEQLEFLRNKLKKTKRSLETLAESHKRCS